VDVTILNAPNPPVKQAYFPFKRKMHITVKTAARIIYIAKDRTILETTGGGIPIADTLGPVELEWSDDLWVLGAVGNAGVTVVDFDL
jgi:hypothetical protein